MNGKLADPPVYVADLGKTVYRIYRMRGKWLVADNHGAVWGGLDTAEEAMNAVEALQ